MSLRRELRWALGATAALTVLALIRWPQQDPMALTVRLALPSMSRVAGTDLNSTMSALPARLDRLTFLPAEKDLFLSPPPPAIMKPVQTAPPVMVAPSAAPPPLPPMTARYLGRVRTLEGQLLVYLRDGEQTVLARPGAALNNGYVVEALLPAPAGSGANADIAAVQLLHPGREHRETLRLPSEP